jgi:dsDNA-specific endonuclease/ATPase MutS2
MTLSKSDKKGVSNVHKDGVIGGLRRGDNTLDLTKCVSETQAQESANKFIEKMIDNSVYTMYIYLGKDPKIDKNKFRGWLKKHPFVRKAETASASDGGESYTILALHTLE